MNEITTAFSFDASRGCIVPSHELRDKPPEDLEKRLLGFRKNREGVLSQSPHHGFSVPYRVPKKDVSHLRTVNQNVPVVMAPPPGYLNVTYNFNRTNAASSYKALSDYLAQQIIARSWEIVRQTLTDLGAKIIVNDPIAPAETNLFKQLDSNHGVYGMQMFCRDAGFVFDNAFYTGSLNVEDETRCALDEQRVLNSKDPFPPEVIRQHYQTMREMRDKQVRQTIEGFKKAGKILSLKEIGTRVDGGDVIVDQRRGIIFIGRETNLSYYKKRDDFSAFALKRATGADVIQIDRHSFFHNYISSDRSLGRGLAYHLDLLMAPLPDGGMLCDSRHTTSASVDLLRHIYGDKFLCIGRSTPLETDLLMPDKAAKDKKAAVLPANLVCIGHTLFMPYCDPIAKKELAGRDISVVSSQTLKLPPSTFFMRGGSIHCITNTMPLMM